MAISSGYYPATKVEYVDAMVALRIDLCALGSWVIDANMQCSGQTDRSVTLAAGALQRKKLIEYTRGAVKIVNRKKLEDSACECYGVIRQYDGELG